VRRIPYGSTGERDPVRIIANNLGSCSGKHILLRDVLRETGREAEIITMFTHFNRGIPSHPAMPPDLRAMVEGEDVCDFHHYVRVRDVARRADSLRLCGQPRLARTWQYDAGGDANPRISAGGGSRGVEGAATDEAESRAA
jgi:hypothetical protein